MTRCSPSVADLARIARASDLLQERGRIEAHARERDLEEARGNLEQARSASVLAFDGWRGVCSAHRYDPLLAGYWAAEMAGAKHAEVRAGEQCTRAGIDHDEAMAGWRLAFARAAATRELLDDTRKRSMRDKEERALNICEDLRFSRAVSQ